MAGSAPGDHHSQCSPCFLRLLFRGQGCTLPACFQWGLMLRQTSFAFLSAQLHGCVGYHIACTKVLYKYLPLWY